MMQTTFYDTQLPEQALTLSEFKMTRRIGNIAVGSRGC